MKFSERLKQLRAEKGMTQKQLAEASGVPLSTIRQYEQHGVNPGWDNVVAIATALGVTPDAFLEEKK
jgi:transcriptional regulator with XRE-family HTH domain